MSRGVNKVILVGNLGSDPEYRQTTDGTQITRCSLATNRVWTTDSGEKQQRTEWHRVIFFRRLAEIASQYLKKGMLIYVEGHLRTNKWEKDGVQRYTTEIIVENMQMLSSRSSGLDDSPYANDTSAQESPADSSEQKTGNEASPNQGQEQNKGNNYQDLDDDIPF